VTILRSHGNIVAKIAKAVDEVVRDDVEDLFAQIRARAEEDRLNKRAFVGAFVAISTMVFCGGAFAILRKRQRPLGLPSAPGPKTLGSIFCVAAGLSFIAYACSGGEDRQRHLQQRAHANLKRSKFASDSGMRIPRGCPCCDPRIIGAKGLFPE